MRADMGYPAVRARLDVGAAVERALAPLALKRLEQRVALLHPKRARDLLLHARRHVVVRGEKHRLDAVRAEPRLGQDPLQQCPPQGIADEALPQRHRGDRLPLPALLVWRRPPRVFGNGVIVIVFDSFRDWEAKGRHPLSDGKGRRSWARVWRLTQAEPQCRIRRVVGAVALAQALRHFEVRTRDGTCAWVWVWGVFQFICT